MTTGLPSLIKEICLEYFGVVLMTSIRNSRPSGQTIWDIKCSYSPPTVMGQIGTFVICIRVVLELPWGVVCTLEFHHLDHK